jgi:hypothetical protein
MQLRTRCLLAALAVLAATQAWATPRLSLVASPFESPGPGRDVVVAIAASSADGVTAMDLSYTFDRSVLTPTGVFLTGFTAGFTMSSNLTTPGLVAIHLERSNPLIGSGDVAWVTFRVASGTAGTVTPLSWAAASVNGGSMSSIQQGTNLAIGASPAAISTSRGAFGVHGSQVVVPISAEALTGGSSFDLVLTFDPNVLAATSVQKTTLTSCMSMVPNVSVPGTVRISMYGLCAVTGSGSLVLITFNVVGATGSRTPLNVTRGSIDEDNYPTVLQDGLFNVCGTPDADGDGYSVCAGDCNDADPAVHPGAFESCNGIDDDCNGATDDAVRPVGTPTIVLAQDGGGASLSWTPVDAATAYDVVRGDLSSLRSGSGDFSRSTDLCLGSRVTTNSSLDGSFPAPGGGYWYLVRPENCGGPGSYDGEGYLQPSPRDTGIGASPYACP